MTIKEGLPKTKEGLPKEAFAIIGDLENPETWKLPHHTRAVVRKFAGRLNIEKTVDWQQMNTTVAALSLGGYRRQRLEATPEEILQAAKHLAAHYQKAGKSLPHTLAALI